jgi:hypothetical protein
MGILSNLPLVGGLFPDNNEANKNLQMDQASRAYQAQRPENQQNRMNSLSNMLSNFQPAADVLAAMNGGRSPVSAQVNSNPMGPTSMSQGGPGGGEVANRPGAPWSAGGPRPQQGLVGNGGLKFMIGGR